MADEDKKKSASQAVIDAAIAAAGGVVAGPLAAAAPAIGAVKTGTAVASAPPDPSKVPLGEDIPPDPSAMDALGESSTAENDFTGTMREFPKPPPGGSGAVLSGDNPAAVGGEQWWNQRFDTSQKALNDATAKLGQLSEDEGKRLADKYQQQSDDLAKRAAANEVRRSEDDAYLRAQQEEIKARTAEYTKDLADTGKFWRNPGNIISAIAYSFMPLTGAPPGTGIKLINQVVQEDYAQRKQMADTHLGALRSNFQQYREIAKDREAGDLLALSESHRLAALEIQRISAQFQGAKAKANAEMAVADQQQKSAEAAMLMFNRLRYIHPQAAQKPVADAYKATPGYVDYTKAKPPPGAPAGRVDYKGRPLLSPEQGGPTEAEVAKAAAQGYRVTTPGATTAGQASQAEKPRLPTPQEAASGGLSGTGVKFAEQALGKGNLERLERRVPGLTQRMDEQHAQLIMDALRRHPRAMQDPHEWEKANKEYQDRIDKVQEEAGKAVAMVQTSGAATDAIAYAQLQHDMAYLRSKFKGDEKTLNDFLGKMRQAGSSGAEAGRKMDEVLVSYGLTDERDREARIKALRLGQQVAGVRNIYFRTNAGGNVTGGEESRLSDVISRGTPWSGIESFVRDQSRATQSKVDQAAGSSMHPLARDIFYIRIGQPGLAPSVSTVGKKQREGVTVRDK